MSYSVRLSVVIPAFNAEKTLEAAILSVASQSRAASEVIVVDNASTDQTSEILKELKIKYGDWFHTLRVEKNVGPAGARNIGWKAATAPFISFLDSDDTWENTKIEKTFERLSQGYDFICHWEYLKEGSKVLKILKHGYPGNITYLKMLFGENQMSTSAVTVSRVTRKSGFEVIKMRYAFSHLMASALI